MNEESPDRVLRPRRVLEEMASDEMPLDKWHWDEICTGLDNLKEKWGRQSTRFLEVGFVGVGGVITVAFVLVALIGDSNPSIMEVLIPWIALALFVTLSIVCFFAHKSKVKDRQNEVEKLRSYARRVEAKYQRSKEAGESVRS